MNNNITELVVNINFTTGYELSFVEVMNMRNMVTKQTYISTNCLEFAKSKYLDIGDPSFKTIVLAYDDKTKVCKKGSDVEKELAIIMELVKGKPYTGKIRDVIQNRVNSFPTKINQVLTNMNATEEVLNYLQQDIDTNLELINFLRLNKITVEFTTTNNPYGAVNINLFNIAIGDQVLMVNMFNHIDYGGTTIYLNYRVKYLKNDKDCYIINNINTVKEWCVVLTKAINKVVFNSEHDRMINYI